MKRFMGFVVPADASGKFIDSAEQAVAPLGWATVFGTRELVEEVDGGHLYRVQIREGTPPP